jgi:NitT/TauT family transport system permease protein
VGSWWKPAAAFVGLVVLWQVSTWAFAIPTYLLPSPIEVGRKLAEIPDRYFAHTLVTLSEVLAGFALAAVVGVMLAVLITHSRLLAETLLPLLVLQQVVPQVAIAPLLVVWCGPGFLAKLIVVFLIAFFPIVINTSAGLLRVDADLIDLMRGLKASRWTIFIKIRMPNAIPHLMTGMRISITLAVIGAVVAEFVAASAGLGYLIYNGSNNLDTPLLFGAVVVLAVIGITLFSIVRAVQRVTTPWARALREGEA